MNTNARMQVIADLDSNGNVLRSYVWGEGIDRLLAVKVGAKSYAALTDVQGTVWGLADGMDVVACWTYDAWGNVLSGEASDPALAAFRYRFQGREFSVATGLTNFRMRWYDPRTGRWLSKDPIRLDGGINLYAFCDGDPLNSVDCMGECPVEPPPGTGVLGPPRRSPSGTTYRADPFGHGVNPETNVPLDPHVHQIPRRGKPRIFNMDGRDSSWRRP